MLLVDATTLPSGRRGFAATLIEGGMVLIHGGCDATMETVYSDGWILDTTKNPMVWTAVPQLSQLGPRRDHFAAAFGSSVVFGFGMLLIYLNTSIRILTCMFFRLWQ